MWLLANWKILLMAGVAAVAFGTGWYVASQFAESRLESALLEQQIELAQQCENAKKITEEVGNVLQSKVTDLSKRVAAYRMRKPPACVRVTNTAVGNDGAAGAGHVGAIDVDAESLTSYGELAEKHRLQLIACQEFVRKERE